VSAIASCGQNSTVCSALRELEQLSGEGNDPIELVQVEGLEQGGEWLKLRLNAEDQLEI